MKISSLVASRLRDTDTYLVALTVGTLINFYGQIWCRFVAEIPTQSDPRFQNIIATLSFSPCL